METGLLLIRHAASAVHLGPERTRGLTVGGQADVSRLTASLWQTRIDAVVSSPYARAVMTVQGIADERGLPVEIVEDLRERRLHGEEGMLRREDFLDAVKRSFGNSDAALPGGETFREAQRRGVNAVRALMARFPGQTVAVGTHGNLMTMILQAFDGDYGFQFWESLSMPDVYRLTFGADDKLLGVRREWH